MQRVDRRLTKEEWDEMSATLKRIGFWSLSTELSGDGPGPDGSSWIIEGRAGAYHIVERWVGGEDTQEAGEKFLALAGISLSD